jgi:hypothetical protein
MRKPVLLNTAVLLLLPLASLAAQDFGFGFNDEDTGESSGDSRAPAVSVSGEVTASLLGYTGDFSDGADHIKPGDIFSGKLIFSAGGSAAEAVINLNLTTTDSPVAIDEAYLHVYFGSFDVEAGLRKLTWGKADSFGPLDVINPLDNTEMTELNDIMTLKIARPLIHGSLRTGQFSKLEAVFVPVFEPHRLALSGRWAPAQFGGISETVIEAMMPKTDTIDYFQSGLRFTTVAGSSDFGAQYYYGRMPIPAFDMAAGVINYNPYHQIGVDYAQVIAGFNIRAELAANITQDLEGSDGTVHNPQLAWSLGFDRDLFWGINLNLQTNETIRLLDDKVNDPLTDIEAGSNITSTRVTAILSKKFLRDELEFRVSALWGIEDRDFLIIPALVWTKDSIGIEVSGGIFGGDDKGQLGQYRKNNFVKAGLTYTF